jgi:threonylcarbamoyladenosine tRNA methylthiotransferase MtaB
MVRRRNPDTRIVATGCYAERAPADLASLGIDLIAPNRDKSEILLRLTREGYLTGGRGQTGAASYPGRTRTFIKIQDGCHNFCAYCIVPYVRREEKSTPAQAIINTVKQRTQEGYREAVLTGTRIGAYHEGDLDLAGLVTRILRETAIPRLRLSSLQPAEIAPALLNLWKDERLCPHFHLSLQSGSAGVLARMRRRYTPEEYERTVAAIRAHVPEVAVTTDIIVGFPGETDAEFTEGFNFCERMEFARVHVFPFSPRTGTEAAGMKNQVPENVKKERTQRMLALAAESARRFQSRFKGAEMDVLWEQQTGTGVWTGVTGNYIRVRRRDAANLKNRMEKTTVE